jgi:hypothetical protein
VTNEPPAATWRYLELDPPARIVMTHGWLHEGEAPEAVDARATRITVELFDEGPRTRPRTRMVFVQRGFPTPESYPRTATTRGGGAPSVSWTPCCRRSHERRRAPRPPAPGRARGGGPHSGNGTGREPSFKELRPLRGMRRSGFRAGGRVFAGGGRRRQRGTGCRVPLQPDAGVAGGAIHALSSLRLSPRDCLAFVQTYS